LWIAGGPRRVVTILTHNGTNKNHYTNRDNEVITIEMTRKEAFILRTLLDDMLFLCKTDTDTKALSDRLFDAYYEKGGTIKK
jgi:hypothetical protein